jgi:amino acid adenylation domain-containing protein
VPVRVRLDKDKPISQMLEEVQMQAAEMVAYEQYGLRNIAQTSAAAREACDFSSLLVLQPLQSVSEPSGSNEILQGVNVDQSLEGYFTYPLVMEANIYADGVDLLAFYQEDKVSSARLEALFYHLDNVVQQLLEHGGRVVEDLSLAGKWDLQQASTWNIADCTPIQTCVHSLIASQVAQQPHAEAVTSSESGLTYAELDRLSSGLAQELIALGVRPEAMVPLCFEKSMWTVVAMLATLKAGGAFVPIDPSHPEARRRALLEEIDAQLLLVSPTTAASCKGLGPRIFEVSPASLASLALRHDDSGIDSTTLVWPATPENAAYAIFTSGSTGKPKTIVVEHRALCTSIVGHGRGYGMDENSRVLQFSNYTFDATISEIITTLIVGGTVCVPSETQRLSTLASFMRELNVTVAMLTPSFANTIRPEEVPRLKSIVLGGEAPTRETLATWRDHVDLVNAYGPSETAISCLFHRYGENSTSPTTIGRPYNSTCWIVEPVDHNKLAPIGCAGELVVYGCALARGYAGDPQGTARVFLQDAVWLPNKQSEHNRRLYKTGDLVKYNLDGTFEYLGRKDNQVKLRGQRIELGAVEAAIKSAWPDVEHVAVDVSRRSGHDTLVAFTSLEDSNASALPQQDVVDSLGPVLIPMDDRQREACGQLAEKLRATLPGYMVPALFLPLQRMPFSSSMKLDRKRLRELANSLTQDQVVAYGLASGETVAPTTAAELQLRELWASVLKIDAATIGKHDSFLRIGGDSISAIQLVVAARGRGISLTVADVFSDPQLDHMALVATSENMAETTDIASFGLLPAGGRDMALAAVQQQCGQLAGQDIEDAYPCSALQEGLMALAVKQPGSYIAKRFFRLPEIVDLARFRAAWEQTVAKCEILRTRIVALGGVSVQVRLTDDITWGIAGERSSTLSEAVAKANTLEMQFGSRLCQYDTICEKDGQRYFVLIIHHAVFDGWTLQLILSQLYQLYFSGTSSSVTPYAHFIKFTSQLDASAAIQYWRTQLADVHRARFPRPAMKRNGEATSEKQAVTLSIDFPSTSAIAITKATFLRATWAMVLARYNETDDICFGTTVSGRNAPVIGLDRIAGPTVATVPVRIRIKKDQSVMQMLQAIQAQASEMIPHEQFGLQNISKISAAAKNACDFTSLLVVQPMRHIDAGAENLDNLMVGLDQTQTGGNGASQSYFSYPLVLQCMVYDERVDLNFTYDANVLNSSVLTAISHQFSMIVKHLISKAKKPAGKAPTKKKSKK